MIAKTIKQLCWLAVGLLAFSLVGCSHPCSDYLKYPPRIPPEKLVIPPKPISLFQLREYYICVLKADHVLVIRLGQTWKFVLPSDELFDNDTAHINDSYKPILCTIAKFLRTYSKIVVTVSAFSNHVPDEVKSKMGTTITEQLTTDQADAVAKYFAACHVNARLLYGVGKSGLVPVAWDGSKSGQTLNRRVEVTFRYYRDNTAWY